MTTVISLIPNDEHIRTARQALEVAGVAKDKMKVLFRAGDAWRELGGPQKVQVVFKDGSIGALLGLIVGALYGIPAGYFNCLVNGCPAEKSLVAGTLFLLYGIFAGGFLGTLVGLDRLEQDLFSYVEGVRRGEALFVVEASEDVTPETLRILRHEHGMFVHDLAEETETR